MEHQLLGCTSFLLPRIGLRTINFGWRTDESTAHAILDAFQAHDGRFIQGSTFHLAESQAIDFPNMADRIVGRWWRSRGVPRQELILSTRCHVGTVANDRLTDRLAAACDGALKRLGSDYFDLFVCDVSGQDLPVTKVREAMDHLVRTGRVRYLAIAGAAAWRSAETVRFDSRRNHCRIEALQAEYSLHRRTHVEVEFIDLCVAHRMGFIAQFPPEPPPLPSGGMPGARLGRSHVVGRRPLVRLIHTLAGDHGVTPAQISLAWVLHNPAVTAAVVSASSVDQVGPLLRSLEIRLSSEQLEHLDRASREQRVVLTGRRRSPRLDHVASPKPESTTCEFAS